MKIIAVFVAAAALFSGLCGREVLNEKMVAASAPATGPTVETWKKAPSYVMLKNIQYIDDFRVLPRERATVQIAMNQTHLYVRVFAVDSDLVTEAVEPQARLEALGDAVRVFIKPKKVGCYWEIQNSPKGIGSSFFYPGGGHYSLSGSKSPFGALTIKAQDRIRGTINNFSDKDSFWETVIFIRIDELYEQLAKKGIKADKHDGLEIMVGRINFSKYLDDRDFSGFPQPVKNYNSFRVYADIIAGN